MIFISWVLVIIVAIVVIQLPILPFRGMLKEVHQDLLEAWNKFLKIWNSFHAGLKSFYIILFILFSLGFFFYNYNYFNSLIDDHFLSGSEANLDAEFLSNIHRNIWLLFFAIFGVYLAIWARIVSQRQLEKSIQINRNERFAKAVELLAKKDDEISSVGGLYMLRDLINESPKTEYIRCIEIISYWILEHKEKMVDKYLSYIVAKILEIRNSHKGLENIIESYKKENNLGYWPILDTVNLQELYLLYANLQGAYLKNGKLGKVNLEGANLKDVFLENANLQNAILRTANLQKAILANANLQEANLQKVILQEADLRDANLQNSILWSANLQDSILWCVKLQNANLTDANLQGADFDCAEVKDANFTNAKMSNAINLTKQQILSAQWNVSYDNGKPPELPDDLMNDSDVKKWLRKPADCKIKKAKKVVAKKAKAKSKKATARKSKN